MTLVGFPVKANSQRASEAFSPTCQRCRSLHGLSKTEGSGNSSWFLHHWSSRDTGQCRILSLKSALSLARCLQAGLALGGKAAIPPVNMLVDFFPTSLISLILLKGGSLYTVTSNKLEGQRAESENVGAGGGAFKKMVKSYVRRESVIYTKSRGWIYQLYCESLLTSEHLQLIMGLF